MDGVARPADPEGLHDFEHTDDDEPAANYGSQYGERIERPRQDDDAGDNADDTEEDRPTSAGKDGITDCRCRRRHAAEDEPDSDPNGQQEIRVSVVKLAEGHFERQTQFGHIP